MVTQRLFFCLVCRGLLPQFTEGVFLVVSHGRQGVAQPLVCNGDDGLGLDEDRSISDGEPGGLADFEDEGEEVVVAIPDDLGAIVLQKEDLQAQEEAQRQADGAGDASGVAEEAAE